MIKIESLGTSHAALTTGILQVFEGGKGSSPGKPLGYPLLSLCPREYQPLPKEPDTGNQQRQTYNPDSPLPSWKNMATGLNPYQFQLLI